MMLLVVWKDATRSEQLDAYFNYEPCNGTCDAEVAGRSAARSLTRKAHVSGVETDGCPLTYFVHRR